MDIDYESILKKCNHLLEVGGIDDIEDFLPELMYAYDVLDLEATRQSDNYELRRDSLYIHWKQDKNNGKINKSDTDLQTASKHKAQQEFGDRNLYKVAVKHFEKYITLLNSKEIKLMADDKKQRELAGC